MPSFLSPLFLIGAAAAAIPVVLHFLRREPEARIRFAAVHLLLRGPVEQTKNRRLREWLLLALRITALVLLSVAFARPFFAAAADSFGSATVVALDTSLSLSAPGRFERAKALAMSAVERAPAGARVGVVTFADRAQAASPLSADRSLARSAIDAARMDFGSTRYRAALGAAASLLEGHAGTIVLITDMQEMGWDTGDQVALAAGARVEVVDAGAPPANLALTAVRTERERFVATVRNFGDKAREARVELTMRRGMAASGRQTEESGGSALASIGPGQAVDVPLPRPQGDAAVVRVTDADGIEADNVRYLVLDRASRSAVLMATTAGDPAREALYFQQALTAGDNAAPADGVGASQLAGWDAARLEKYSTIVIASTKGIDRKGRDLLRAYLFAGGGLLIAASPEIDSEVVADIVGDISMVPVAFVPGRPASRTLAPVDARHPLFRAFGADVSSLALVTFREMATIQGGACQPLARFTTGEMALLDCSRGQGRALLFASDLDNRWNDFPLRATFVPFVHEAMTYLAGARPRQSEYIVGEAPTGVGRTPGLTAMPASPNSPARWVAVNVDPRESEPARMTSADFDAAVTRVKASAQLQAGAIPAEVRQQEDRQHLWQYVLALVILTLVAETIVAARAA